MAEVADPPARPPRLARQLRAEHLDLARGRAQQGREDPQQGLLPAPFGPSTASVAPGLELERDVAQHRALAVVAAQSAQASTRCLHRTNIAQRRAGAPCDTDRCDRGVALATAKTTVATYGDYREAERAVD